MSSCQEPRGAGSVALAALRAFAVVALACAPACSNGDASAATKESPEPAQRVHLARVERETIHPTLVVPGAVAPLQTVALTNAISEPTLNVDVREGDRVRAGQVLAQLDVDDLEASLAAAVDTARADNARTAEVSYSAELAYAQSPDQVRQSRATRDQAEQTLVEARRNFDRDRELESEGYLPAQNVDEQRVVVETDEAALHSADAQLQSSLSNLRVNGTPDHGLQAATVGEARAQATAQMATAEQLRRQIARATIVSPIDGIVVNRNLNPGEYPSGRQIFTLEAVDTVYAILTASAVQAYEIRPGDAVDVQRAGFPGAAGRGRVEAVLDPATPGSTNYTVKVAVPNARGDLRAGTPVQGIVDLGGVTGAAVPSAAFVDDTRSRIALSEAGRARFVNVREIATDGATSIVVGVAPGSSVVADGATGLEDGSRIEATH